MAGLLQAAVGPWGAVFVSLGLIVSVLGAYLSWSLLAAEVLYSAARMESMPRFLAIENRNPVPAAAPWLTSGLIQLFLIFTLFGRGSLPAGAEADLVAAYALKLAWTRETYAGDPLPAVTIWPAPALPRSMPSA
jgi:arginine:ornithine antiporter/lysine permease